MFGNLCLGVVLVLTAPGLSHGQPLARRIAAIIGLYYATMGVAVYLFSPQRHPGLLTFSALGLVLWAALWVSR
jgi:hypothetical protein